MLNGLRPVYRTNSPRKLTGMKCNKPIYGMTKRRKAKCMSVPQFLKLCYEEKYSATR